MKKFAKMLALGLALAMTFGMTVCAAGSPGTSDPSDDGLGYWAPEGFEAVVTPVTESMANDVLAYAKNSGKDIVEPIIAFSITPPANWDGKPVTIQFVLYHFKDGKFVEDIAVTWNSKDKRYESVITSFSDFVLVKVKDNGSNPPASAPSTSTTTTTATGAPVSPKTGETLPVAGMMAVLCLAGVVVCAKKARCNG